MASIALTSNENMVIFASEHYTQYCILTNVCYHSTYYNHRWTQSKLLKKCGCTIKPLNFRRYFNPFETTAFFFLLPPPPSSYTSSLSAVFKIQEASGTLSHLCNDLRQMPIFPSQIANFHLSFLVSAYCLSPFVKPCSKLPGSLVQAGLGVIPKGNQKRCIAGGVELNAAEFV